MNDLDMIDKQKMQDILDEIANLTTYCNGLANNTRGEHLENYVNNLSKNINQLGNKVDEIYQKNFKTID